MPFNLPLLTSPCFVFTGIQPIVNWNTLTVVVTQTESVGLRPRGLSTTRFDLSGESLSEVEPALATASVNMYHKRLIARTSSDLLCARIHNSLREENWFSTAITRIPRTTHW